MFLSRVARTGLLSSQPSHSKGHLPDDPKSSQGDSKDSPTEVPGEWPRQVLQDLIFQKQTPISSSSTTVLLESWGLSLPASWVSRLPLPPAFFFMHMQTTQRQMMNKMKTMATIQIQGFWYHAGSHLRMRGSGSPSWYTWHV